jgi:hypothetical protein
MLTPQNPPCQVFSFVCIKIIQYHNETVTPAFNEGVSFSMTMKSQIEKIGKKMTASWRKAVQRALSKSGKQAKTEWSRQFRQFTGLKLADANKRLKQFKTEAKPAKGIFSTGLGLATKVGLPLRKFKPKAEKVDSRLGKRLQASVQKLGGGGRELVPNAFVMNKNGNKFVAKRKGVNRTPTVEAKTAPDVIFDWGVSVSKGIQKFMSETFDRLVDHEVEFEFKKNLDKK